MRIYTKLLLTVFLFVFIGISCKKTDFKKEINADALGLAAERKASMSTTLSSTTCVEDQENGMVWTPY